MEVRESRVRVYVCLARQWESKGKSGDIVREKSLLLIGARNREPWGLYIFIHDNKK